MQENMFCRWVHLTEMFYLITNLMVLILKNPGAQDMQANVLDVPSRSIPLINFI